MADYRLRANVDFLILEAIDREQAERILRTALDDVGAALAGQYGRLAYIIGHGAIEDASDAYPPHEREALGDDVG